MTTSTYYTSNKSLFSVWQQTQLSIFKRAMEKIQLDFFKAGKVFATLADNLNRLPNFEEFEEKYNENN
jgi:hypothetical protein